MKLEVALVAVTALLAGSAAPAMAQGSFSPYQPKATFTPGGMAPPRPASGYGAPSVPAAPAYGGSTTARIYGPPATPKAEPFKPYTPYKPASVFGPDKKKR